MRAKSLEQTSNAGYLTASVQRPSRAGCSVIRSANDSGPNETATVGCGQAVGSPKGEAPAARATQLCKQSPSLSGAHEAGVQSEGSAPRVNLSTRRTGPLRVWLMPLGSGPMSFARDLTKGQKLGAHRRSDSPSTPRARFSASFSAPGQPSKKIARSSGEGVVFA